jgi:hypothetical protein
MCKLSSTANSINRHFFCQFQFTSRTVTNADSEWQLSLLQVNNCKKLTACIDGNCTYRIGDLLEVQHNARLDVSPVQSLLQPPLLQPYPSFVRARNPPTASTIGSQQLQTLNSAILAPKFASGATSSNGIGRLGTRTCARGWG